MHRKGGIDSADRLIIALDVDSEDKAMRLVEKLKGRVKFFKVGLELFSSCGPAIIDRIKEAGCGVFLDLKFHDIPNTVSKAAVSVTRLGVFMLNIHALGGYEMIRKTVIAVSEEARKKKLNKPKILAVTILTSMDGFELNKIGISDNIEKEVLKLARLSKAAGADGVVASPQETALIRKECGKDFIIVTPGVRPEGAGPGDQKRFATPRGAITGGADFIVVGRPIIEAPDPLEAARKVLEEIES
ncbi:MAG: orotidine-5'-phosphate decarboxylase [Candidatus Omnitrophota bacterium]|nr:orotidine-5'-phosphate decarboxylase [Candidatus Omnitrophota bacterium]